MYMYNCMLPYQLYVGPLNSEAGQTGGMRAVRKETRKARRVLPDLGFDKIDKNQTQLRYFEISINKIPARRYVKNFQVGQWFFPLLIIYLVFARKCSMRFHSAKDMDDALSIGRFVEILLLDKKCQQLLDLIVFCFKRYVANFFVSLFLWLIIIWRQIKASPDVLNTS